MDVAVSLYDLSGRLTREFDTGTFAAGNHALDFNGKGLSNGMYILGVQAGQQPVARTKVVILK
jgi:hypothetical protein